MPDTELPGYEQLIIGLPEAPTYAYEPEGSLVATLIRRNLPTGPRAVLYLHGWNDYFFQAHLADEMAGQGYDFYALDLRRYGRSLRERQLAGYIVDLTDYFQELDEALAILVDEGHDDIVLMGHSTGGLIAALWADARPGVFSALILNAPWLDLQANSPLRPATQPMLSAARTVVATSALPHLDTGFYRRSISRAEEGEWEFNANLKGDPAFLIRVGWMAAILEGHARVAAGIFVDCPVLVALSRRSDFGRVWAEEFRLADIVLDVDRIAARAPQLGSLVVIARIEDAVHDLVLSREDVRAKVFGEFARFLRCYAG